MKDTRSRRSSLARATAAALGAIAMLALPGLATANAKDRNHDRIPDRWERHHHLSLKVKQTWRDQDRDQLRNRQEFLAGTNPRDRDSDDDGVPDGKENAGRIQSFDPATGRLVIDLFGGDTISGLVNERTEIECDHRGHPATASDSHDGEGDAGSDRGEEESGDDHGEDAEEPGDDHGEDGAGPGDDHGEDGAGPGDDRGGDHAGPGCTTADLVEGAIVQEAELKLQSGGAIFEKVELAG